MTKEALKKEANDYANNWLEEVHKLELEHKIDPKPKYIRIQQAYLAGAEPREKRIAELENSLLDATEKTVMRIAELEERLTKAKKLLDDWITYKGGAKNLKSPLQEETERFLKEIKVK